MRRLPIFVIATGLAVFMMGGFASAGPASISLATSASSLPSYLPAGETPADKNWLSGEGDLSNSRFSTLTQINSTNVQRLQVKWNAQLDPLTNSYTESGEAEVENTPICCANGMMYVTYVQGVMALNPATGATIWNYSGPTHPGPGTTAVNVSASRVISYDPTLNTLYAGQQDGSIVALNAKTGTPIWTVSVTGAGTYGAATGTESAPFTAYYSEPGTNGIVLSAPNGGESPFRGHMDAYDAKTGALVWRTWNTPDPTQIPYILSWGNPAEAATAGAAVWSVPAVDPELGTVYYGSGNPYPETGRSPGDDLWTETIMALDSKTGALKWYFQLTHHDELDFDVPHPPMVLKVPINGKTTTVVAVGSKDGYFYVLNAKNGSQVPNFKIVNTPTYDPSGNGIEQNNLSKSQPVPQGAAGCMVIMDYSAAGLAKCGFPANTVATEYGGTNNVNVQPDGSVVNAANGRPIKGTPFWSAFDSSAYFVFGGAGGGGNFGYPPSAYDPQTHEYVACLQNESGAHSNTSANTFTQSSLSASTAIGITGFVSSINLTNDTMAWQFQSLATSDPGGGPCYSGTLATAGNLVFTAFHGASDQTTCAVITPACAAAGITTPGTRALPAYAPAGNDGGSSPGGNFDAMNATTGKILWTWELPYGLFEAPAMTYSYGGVQYIAIYHEVAPAGVSGSTATGQRDQLTVLSL